jgi:predicted RNase H-like nuclease
MLHCNVTTGNLPAGLGLRHDAKGAGRSRLRRSDSVAEIAGVDGCPWGWIAVVGIEGESPAVEVHPTLAGLLAAHPKLAAIAVDMPIGLPDQIGPGGRGPEAALRPHLGMRQSSVFSVPSRAAVYTPDYREACSVAMQTSDPPRKISKQAFFLFPKIREIDALLRQDASARARIVESHPEGAFMVMNGGRPLAEPKKVKSRPWPAGLAERRALLLAAGIPEPVLAGKPPPGADFDDLLDACACHVVAGRWLRGEARSFPAAPGRDSQGLPMAIWA